MGSSDSTLRDRAYETDSEDDFYEEPAPSEDFLAGMPEDVFNFDFSAFDLKRQIGCDMSGPVVFVAKWLAQEHFVAVRILVYEQFQEVDENWNSVIEQCRVQLSVTPKSPHLVTFYGAAIACPRVIFITGLESYGDMMSRVCLAEEHKEYTGEGCVLSLKTRVRLMHEAAMGLRALHENQNSAHGSFQLKRILLGSAKDPKQENWNSTAASSLTDADSSDFVATVCLPITFPDVAMMHGSKKSSAVYASPEQLDGSVGGTLPSDVYAFGICLHEAVFVRRAFRELNGKLKSGELSNQSEFRPSISEDEDVAGLAEDGFEWLADLMRGCWAADPEERLSIGEVCRTFEEHLEEFVEGGVDEVDGEGEEEEGEGEEEGGEE